MAVGCVKEGENVVAIRLGQMRRRRGWTQEELADRAGASQSQISAWEDGRRRPNIDSVGKLARAFEMPEDRFAQEIGYIGPGPTPLQSTDVFDRTPLARIDAMLRELPVAPGFPSFADQLRQIEALTPAAQERVIRRLGRDFLWRLREELEREEGAG